MTMPDWRGWWCWRHTDFVETQNFASLHIYGIFILATLYGVLNEFVQAGVPGRFFSIEDMLRNAIGVFVGLWVVSRKRWQTPFCFFMDDILKCGYFIYLVKNVNKMHFLLVKNAYEFIFERNQKKVSVTFLTFCLIDIYCRCGILILFPYGNMCFH